MEKTKFHFDERDIVQNGLLAAFYVVITFILALIIGFELYLLGEPFWMSCLTVALGELAVLIVGYIFFMIIKCRKNFFKLIRATQNTEFKF